MCPRVLDDGQWSRLAVLLPEGPPQGGGCASDDRRFVDAVLFLARSGISWRDLPPEFGKWNSVYVRFARWRASGVWERIAASMGDDALIAELFGNAAFFRGCPAGGKRRLMRNDRAGA